MPLKPASPALDEAVKRIAKLPGIGKKAAMRIAVYLLEASGEDVEALAAAIRNVKSSVGTCSICGNWTEQDPCAVCENPQRDHSLLCLVETPADLLAMEGSGFRGIYHVLGGVLSPLEEVGPEQLRIRELLERLQTGNITEVIVATNATMEGDTTALYLQRLLEPMKIKATRIGFGLPVGADLRLADEETLSHAIRARREL